MAEAHLSKSNFVPQLHVAHTYIHTHKHTHTHTHIHTYTIPNVPSNNFAAFNFRFGASDLFFLVWRNSLSFIGYFEAVVDLWQKI